MRKFKRPAAALCLLAFLALLESSTVAAPPTVAIDNKYIHENYTYHHITQTDTMKLKITSNDPDGTTPTLSAANLPAGASFVNNFDGTGTMVWAPSGGQIGFFGPRFSASDGTGADTDTATILVVAYPLSHGFYRLGYVNGQNVRCGQDHLSHDPILKLDLFGSPQFQGTDSVPIEYQLAASADGRVEQVIDTNCACCTGCAACNNHVRIRHSNGEWTKYTHFEQGSVVVDTTIANACVTAGTELGEEGDVGATSGSSPSFQRNQKTCGNFNDCSPSNWSATRKCFVHEHYEVRMTGPSSGLRIPLFCGIPGNIFRRGDSATAANCSASACATNVNLPTVAYAGNFIKVEQADNQISTNNSTYSVQGTASVAFHAGNRVTLLPGFSARRYSYFHAWIGPCNGGNTGCPPN